MLPNSKLFYAIRFESFTVLLFRSFPSFVPCCSMEVSSVCSLAKAQQMALLRMFVDKIISVQRCRVPEGKLRNPRALGNQVTYYHVSLEAWEGYANDWNYIQRTYPSMAPKSLGRMGYAGPTAMFVPKPVQQQAYSTEGRALEFYRQELAKGCSVSPMSCSTPGNLYSPISNPYPYKPYRPTVR